MNDPPSARLDRIRGALMEGGRSSSDADDHTHIQKNRAGVYLGAYYNPKVFGREETWRAAEVARSGRPRCRACWMKSFDIGPMDERDAFRRQCLAAGWLMDDCYRPGR